LENSQRTFQIHCAAGTIARNIDADRSDMACVGQNDLFAGRWAGSVWMRHNWTIHRRGHQGAEPPARHYSEPIGVHRRDRQLPRVDVRAGFFSLRIFLDGYLALRQWTTGGDGRQRGELLAVQ
jgi:hypothetical protein